MELSDFISIALIILSLALIAAILLQARGGGFGSFIGEGGLAGGYKTRRGLEKTLFQVTIGISAAFFILVVLYVFFIGI